MGGGGAVREDEPREAPKRTPRRAEATDLTATFHAVHLRSRPHIDLQRVAAALCCS
ncbi:putative leader peptide [Streptomyces massasporeus]